MKKRIAPLMMGTLLLLTACGQTGNSSTSTMLPVAAVQSAAQAIAPAEDKAQEDVDSLLGEENTEEAEPAGGEDTPKLANSAETPSGKMEVTPPPTAPEEPVMPAPAPTPAEEQEQTVPEVAPEPAPAPEPAASGNIYSIAEAIQAGNEYARAQCGVTIDTSMTAAVKGNVDATFACLAAMDGAETVSAYARFNCTARYDAASDEYIVVVLYG